MPRPKKNKPAIVQKNEAFLDLAGKYHEFPEIFQPQVFDVTPPPTDCIYCFQPFATVKTFKGKNSKGIVVRCPACYARTFYYTPESALVAEAYRRIVADPQTGPALKAALLLKVDEIQREKGILEATTAREVEQALDRG